MAAVAGSIWLTLQTGILLKFVFCVGEVEGLAQRERERKTETKREREREERVVGGGPGRVLDVQDCST